MSARDVASLRRVRACGGCRALNGPDVTAVQTAELCDDCAARIVAWRDREVCPKCGTASAPECDPGVRRRDGLVSTAHPLYPLSGTVPECDPGVRRIG